MSVYAHISYLRQLESPMQISVHKFDTILVFIPHLLWFCSDWRVLYPIFDLPLALLIWPLYLDLLGLVPSSSLISLPLARSAYRWKHHLDIFEEKCTAYPSYTPLPPNAFFRQCPQSIPYYGRRQVEHKGSQQTNGRLSTAKITHRLRP